ncbi:uncharacterized protein LOC129605639 [Condylostylus longicornis]|uniref:uncharacterized protein LOC129605639 n=1 Tax=Condylostylus longicornis TaxID=2530218 RepID=UPI00244DDA5A|nr:uncharacterized protein LOC129605639 [Condylostylus longicornis]
MATVSYFQNIEYPQPSLESIVCTFTIALNENIQQILLEFLIFELRRPTDGNCDDDEFLVTGQNRNFIVPLLCGINTGQHMFIDVDKSPTKIIHLSIYGKLPYQRTFNIKVTQVQNRITSKGCLQYFSGRNGIIKSFNYDVVGDTVDSKEEASYFNNLNYAICIEREENMCSITYTNVINDEMSDFSIVNVDTYKNSPSFVNYCPDDFLAINGDRLCGEILSDTIASKSIYDDADNPHSITDYGTGPIILSFKSDNMYVGRGFKIHYEQNFCN